MAVIGLDLSLTSTGIAIVQDEEIIDTANFKSKGKRGMTYGEWMGRIQVMSDVIRVRLDQWIDNYAIDLVVIEAPSFGSKFGNPHERAGLWWDIYRMFWLREIPIETLAPKSRAKYIAGSGNAGKEEVLEAARERWGEIENHDIADAVGLAFWGEEQLCTTR